MKLFLDSADLGEIKAFARWKVLDGITTTPTFFRRLNIEDVRGEVKRIAAEFPGEIHIEAMGRNADEIIAAARSNRELGDRVVSKVPIGEAGLEATSRLSEEGIAVNLHLVFTVNQAILAAKAGAAYVCLLWGRMRDAGHDAHRVALDARRALQLYPTLSAQLMLSSIRDQLTANRAILTGAEALTIPPKVLKSMVASPLTDQAFQILAEDAATTAMSVEWMRPVDEMVLVPPDEKLDGVLVMMTEKGIGIAAVVDAAGSLLGVATDGDLRRALTRGVSADRANIEHIMKSEARVVDSSQRVSAAIALMRDHRVSQVLVVDDKRHVLGYISLHDLMASP